MSPPPLLALQITLHDMDAYRLSPNEIQQRKANRKKYGTPSPVAASRSRTAASSAKENLGAPDFAADVSLAEQSLVDLSIETDADAGAKWTTTVTEAAHEAAALAADSPLNLAPRRVPAASASFAPAAPVDLGGTMDVHRYVRYLEKHQSDLAAGFAAEARIDAPASKPKPVAPKTKPKLMLRLMICSRATSLVMPAHAWSSKSS